MALFCAISVVSKTNGRVSSPLSSGHDSPGSFLKKAFKVASFIQVLDTCGSLHLARLV